MGEAFLSSSGKGEPGKAPRPLRILVADDDRDTVLSFMMLLREEGYDVEGAYSGTQALSRIVDFDADVVIVDIDLPERSGWEVARTIRARRDDGRPTLIGISGKYKSGSDKVLSQVVGLNHYLVKPCAPDELLALIAPLCGNAARKQSTAPRLIAMAVCLVGDPERVRNHIRCSPSEFMEYCSGRKELSWPEVDRLVSLITDEQRNIIAKNRELMATPPRPQGFA